MLAALWRTKDTGDCKGFCSVIGIEKTVTYEFFFMVGHVVVLP